MDIFNFIEDIVKYLNDDVEGDYETSQEFIGFKKLFKGMVVRDWKGADMKYYKYRTLNKILVRKCVYFYKEYWDHRSKAYYDEEKQRNRIRK